MIVRYQWYNLYHVWICALDEDGNIVSMLQTPQLPEGVTVEKEPTPTASEAREYRTQLLLNSDWLAIADLPLDATVKADILAYRQALRDVPQQAGFPDTIDWPSAVPPAYAKAAE